MIKKYTHKPTKIKAIQYNSNTGLIHIARLIGEDMVDYNTVDGILVFNILKDKIGSKSKTVQEIRLEIGDYLIKYPTGCFHVIPEERFKRYYEYIEEEEC